MLMQHNQQSDNITLKKQF